MNLTIEKPRSPKDKLVGLLSLKRVIDAAVGAFSEFLSRDLAFLALIFVVLFKFTDALSGTMTAPL